jgi:hypothetical protein
MSTAADTSISGLKAITEQIMAIIMGARQLPPGNVHFQLHAQISALVVCNMFLFCSFHLLNIRAV